MAIALPPTWRASCARTPNFGAQDLPYDRYLFLNLLTGGGGGMEHSNSTALMSSRWGTRTAAITCAGWIWPATSFFTPGT